MKIIEKALSFCVLVFSLCSGCEFHPDDIPETLIEPPEQTGPPISFRLNDSSDTIRMGWKMDFQYTISGTNNKIRSVLVNFEGKEFHHYFNDNNQTFTFSFDPASYSNGNYHLNIEIITATSTGSLASKIGAEGYLYKLDWPVYIDKTMPEGIYKYTINAIHSTKGIGLSWPSFNHPNFNSYVIYRQNPPFQQSAVPIATIMNPLITTYTDTTYWEGQNSIYYLGIQTPAGIFNGNYIWVFNQLTGLKADWHPDGTVDVRWDKAKNLESFSEYYLYTGFNYTDFIEEYTIGNPDQSFVTLKNAGFGSGLQIFLKLIPKEVNKSDFNYLQYASIELRPPPMLPVHWTSFNVNGRSFLLLADSKKIYRYYPSEVRTEDSISVNRETDWLLTVSNNGDKFVYYHSGNFYVRHTDNFILENEFVGPSLKSANQTMVYCSLSDNGKLLALDYEGIAYLYNTNNGALIHKDTLVIDGYPVKFGLISPDGTKMVAHTNNGLNTSVFYSFEQEGWKETGRAKIDPFKIFYSKDGTTIYIAGYSKVEIRGANDFMLISSYSIPEGYFRSVDLDHGRFLWDMQTGQNSLLVDLKTGLVIRTLILGNAGMCRPFDNYIISSYGLQLTLPKIQ